MSPASAHGSGGVGGTAGGGSVRYQMVLPGVQAIMSSSAGQSLTAGDPMVCSTTKAARRRANAPDDVRAIRASAESRAALMARYDVTGTTIYAVRHRHHWRHVD